MSKETAQWLNGNTLIGFTAKRGNAWHYRADLQSAEPNHYMGAIPVEDVRRRLFHWSPVEGSVDTTFITEDGVTTITDPTRKTIIRPDTATVLGVFKQGFQIHDYSDWLVSNVQSILDDDLQVGSAGLLKGGALAWVQCELSENVTTPEGVEFRPFLMAATSLDGSLSSTYQTGAQVVVCDNTLSAALGEDGAKRVKIKHSSRSLGRIGSVRDALGIVHSVGEDFAAQVAALCSETVSEAQWSAFLDAHVPVGSEGRGATIAENKREALTRLWVHDARVSPWKGTAFGVVQAVNTYTHHEKTVRGAERSERNATRVVTGGIDALDASTLELLRAVSV